MNPREKLHQAFQNEVDRLREKVIHIADYIHCNPELGYKEIKACDRIISESG